MVRLKYYLLCKIEDRKTWVKIIEYILSDYSSCINRLLDIPFIGSSYYAF